MNRKLLSSHANMWLALGLSEAVFAVQSHAFHLAFTTVIGLAAYQAVIALARNSEDFDTWDGVLMTGANVALLFPVLAIPIIFGGLRSRRLRDLTPALVVSNSHAFWSACTCATTIVQHWCFCPGRMQGVSDFVWAFLAPAALGVVLDRKL